MMRLQRLGKDETGMTYVFIGLGMMALFGASMLAIDVGMLMTARNQAQNSADAAALAGATALAFDSWTDRTPSGPAVQNAIRGGTENLVQRAAPSVRTEDVDFPADPVSGEFNRVHVKVWRTTGRGNPVSTLIASYFGMGSVDIGAEATAEAAPANAMTCVKPFTIPDKWDEKQSPPFDPDNDSFTRYDNKGNVLAKPDVYVPAYDQNGNINAGYTGYNVEANRGLRMVLHASQGNQISPSLYFSLAMGTDTGGDDYRWNIANCNHTIYHWGDPLTSEPGNKEGPTIDGITELVAKDPGAYWDTGCNCVKGSTYGDRQSPRIFPIPLFDPDYYDYGHQTGRVASLKTANWIGYFVEYLSGTEIHGRVIPIAGIRDKSGTAGIPSFPRSIRLVQ